MVHQIYHKPPASQYAESSTPAPSAITSEGCISSPYEGVFQSCGNLSFAWTDEHDPCVSSASLSYLVHLPFPTWCQGRCRETSSIYSSCVRYVAMKPTVRCCAERPLTSLFITYLLSLLTPHVIVWDDTFATSTWRLSSRSLPFELTMAHGFDELSQAGEQSERITIAFLALAWFFIILRVWTRTWIIASFGWDDATMILAGVCLTTV
jgi:hypothetical protein